MIDILLVEDNRELSQLMSTFLVAQGYQVYCAMSGEEALRIAKEDTVRLVLLDIMLPGVDGFYVCRALRQQGNIPIIILSARVDKESKVNGFSYGADDYIEKPVDIDVLNLKIKALFKRYYQLEANQAEIVSGAIRLNQDTMEVFFHDRKLNVTTKEYDLLLLFLENPGKALTKEFIFNSIWGMDSESESQTLTVHIKMLRDKIEENPKKPQRIVTVWGVGYRYEKI